MRGWRGWLAGLRTPPKDGGFYLCTPVDPVLLALPLLQKAASDSRFQLLEQIFDDPQFPSAGQLEGCAGLAEGLGQVCQIRGDVGYSA